MVSPHTKREVLLVSQRQETLDGVSDKVTRESDIREEMETERGHSGDEIEVIHTRSKGPRTLYVPYVQQ